jgi:hypothetical protein
MHLNGIFDSLFNILNLKLIISEITYISYLGTYLWNCGTIFEIKFKFNLASDDEQDILGFISGIPNEEDPEVLVAKLEKLRELLALLGKSSGLSDGIKKLLDLIDAELVKTLAIFASIFFILFGLGYLRALLQMLVLLIMKFLGPFTG